MAGTKNDLYATYDPLTDTWCLGSPPFHYHRYGVLVFHNNTFFMLGGWNSGYGTNEIDEMKLDKGCWTKSEIKMPASLEFHDAMVLNLVHED